MLPLFLLLGPTGMVSENGTDLGELWQKSCKITRPHFQG